MKHSIQFSELSRDAVSFVSDRPLTYLTQWPHGPLSIGGDREVSWEEWPLSSPMSVGYIILLLFT